MSAPRRPHRRPGKAPQPTASDRQTDARSRSTQLEHPIVQAPLAGGASTPALAAAVSRGRRARVPGRGLQDRRRRPRGRRGGARAHRAAVRRQPVRAAAAGARPGARSSATRRARASATASRSARRATTTTAGRRSSRCVAELRVPVVSFTFGCPERGRGRAAARGRRRGLGHRDHAGRGAQRASAPARTRSSSRASRRAGTAATFDDAAPDDLGLLAALQLVAAASRAAARRDGRARDRARGRRRARRRRRGGAARHRVHAHARRPGTSPAHRDGARGPRRRPALTRAFTGRTARGIVNRFLREHAGRRAARLSRRPPRHRAAARGRARARRRRRLPPVGGPGARAGRAGAGRRARRLAAEARAPDGAGCRGALGATRHRVPHAAEPAPLRWWAARPPRSGAGRTSP